MFALSAPRHNRPHPYDGVHAPDVMHHHPPFVDNLWVASRSIDLLQHYANEFYQGKSERWHLDKTIQQMWTQPPLKLWTTVETRNPMTSSTTMGSCDLELDIIRKQPAWCFTPPGTSSRTNPKLEWVDLWMDNLILYRASALAAALDFVAMTCWTATHFARRKRHS